MNVLGVDIGGTGIKGAPVDTVTGKLIAERYRLLTPTPATPEAMSDTLAQVVDHFNWKGVVGCGFPAAIREGQVLTAANVAESWIGRNAQKLFAQATGCSITVVNDADAAGYAEMRFGAGRVLVRPVGQRSLVMKVPVGPVASFAPWNFPVGNPARKLGAAIGAGCSCILKPAEETPASDMAVIQALLDAGLPAGVAQLVFGVPDQVSTHLLASPVIRKLSFTGSVPVGKHLSRLAAANMQRTTMELGGHAPVLVFEDADLDKVLRLMVAGKYRNAGQVCVSPTRFYVQSSIYPGFVRRFTEGAAAIRVGNGLDAGVHMGPMANPRRPEAIAALVEDALAQGATLNTGGQRIDGPGFFFEPTVLSDIPDSARIMNEEPFGPVALLNPFDDYDDAIAKANRLPYGLAAFAFTGSADTALRVGDDIEAGMVGVNTNMIAGPDAPFQGLKESGHGSEDGPEGLEACLVTKTIHQG
jgi:succinate-semialdehyde dehydrogenase/glutarate-semialdehyde dehydrogenase